jgi:hypothetical protein
MTDAGRRQADEAFSLLRPFELDRVDLERLSGFDGDGSFDLHFPILLRCPASRRTMKRSFESPSPD